jgi:hypothetical protein
MLYQIKIWCLQLLWKLKSLGKGVQKMKSWIEKKKINIVENNLKDVQTFVSSLLAIMDNNA